MLDLPEAQWAALKGGYRTPYDPRPAVRALEAGENEDAVWEDLWEEVHHQGDVGDASYVVVVELARLLSEGRSLGWNAYAMAGTIETARLRSAANPAVPLWLSQDYAVAWVRLRDSALAVLPMADEDDLIGPALAVIALQKGLPALARMAVLKESERVRILDDLGWGEREAR
ncbi:hypothetical protein [Caulobacter mirabilis]|uniref:Uncharacterized protein n=1 Tax=Caulobacter mirabilis TaxID=69666 RepID=A0A2D2AXE6_9CAUL|nr:hypothetical protein [Caulobacter mirabilis]ATQ42676.1 hypothetical protein CSW64_09760 [Caulobacter mirabilis]